MKSRKFNKISNHTILIALSLLMIYPVIWWVGASLKKPEELTLATIWPKVPMWENYVNGWMFSSEYSFSHFFANTLIMEFWNVLGAVLTSALVAYGFARL